MSIDRSRRIQTEIDRTDMHTEYGAYHFADDNITTLSQPDVATTLEAIAAQPSRDTLIVTPELSLMNDDEFGQLAPGYGQGDQTNALLTRRIHDLEDISDDTTNTIMMGVPVRSPYGRNNNGLVVAKNGKIIHTQRKQALSMVEEQLGWFEHRDAPNRYQQMGRMALICSELAMVSDPAFFEKVSTDTLLVPAMWGVPSTTPEAYARHGGRDGYHAYALGRAAQLAMEAFPRVNRIYVADRSVAGSVPQSGRLKAKRDD